MSGVALDTPGVHAAVVEALALIHDPNTSEAARVQASAFCETFKADVVNCCTFALSVSLGQQIGGDTGTLLHHFALHCLEHIVTHSWNKLPAQQQQFLRDQMLALVKSGVPSVREVRFIKEKVITIVAEVAKRLWPQRWPDMTTELFAIAQIGGGTYTAIVLGIFRNLGEEIVAFSPLLADKRRREVQQGLLECMPQIFPFCHGVIQKQFLASQQNRDAETATLLRSGLDCLQVLMDFIPSNYVFETSVLPDLCQVLLDPAYSLQTSKMLNIVARRKPAAMPLAHQPLLIPVWSSCAGLLSSLLSVTFQSPEDKIALLTSLLRVLDNLTRLHAVLLKPEEQQELRVAFLSLLVQLLGGESVGMSLITAELWSFILRSLRSELLRDSYRQNLLSELVKCSIVRLVKQSDQSEEFDTPEQYRQHFSKFRGIALSLCGDCARLEPQMSLSLIGERYRQLLATAVPKDNLNSRGYATVGTLCYRELEAAAVVLEAMLRHLPDVTSSAPPPAVLHVCSTILGLLLQWQTKDPLLLTRRLHDLELFTGLYDHSDEALSAIIPQLLLGLQFVSAEDVGKPWIQFPEDVQVLPYAFITYLGFNHTHHHDHPRPADDALHFRWCTLPRSTPSEC
jgi:hypothetical protein